MFDFVVNQCEYLARRPKPWMSLTGLQILPDGGIKGHALQARALPHRNARASTLEWFA
jgi:hypothetical protein